MELGESLREIAQRGVIKISNAVRAAQTNGEEGSGAGKSKGVVGICEEGVERYDLSLV